MTTKKAFNGQWEIVDSRNNRVLNTPSFDTREQARTYLKSIKKQRGFTLIELLIVVAIILIIAAIAVPRLLSARASALEGKAASMTRTVGNNVAAFNIKWGVYPAALANLGGTTCDTAAPTVTAGCLMDDAIATQLAAPGVGQYTYTFAPSAGGGFTLNVDPLATSSAHRHFYLDSGLTVHFSDTVAATATDPAL